MRHEGGYSNAGANGRRRGCGITGLPSFDYVIVGAGSAGSVLANRLSTDARVSVCLIEAGPADRSPFISIPLGLIWLAKDRRHNWLFSSAPQKALDGRRVSVPRGKVLGGSSAINGMIYIRGHRDDYDGWARAGCAGWDYQSVLPYFKRSEANTDPDLDDTFHGRDGPLAVSNLRDPNPMDQAFIEAAGRLQIRPCDDFNEPEPEGVGIYQVTQKNGRRHSSAAAFLNPVSGRNNLNVITGAEARYIEFEDGRAVSVSIRRNGHNEKIEARAEIILCAGTIGSPDLLLRSGIGPAAQIKKTGGSVLEDVPGVGQNLQDHTDVMIICRSISTAPYGITFTALPRLAGEALRWVTSGRGMLSSNMVEAGGFVRTSAEENRPDIQFHIIPGRKSHRGRMIEYGHGISLHTCILQPESRGSVTRDSPDGPPVIDLGLLSDPTDMKRLVKGVRLARNILAQDPFAGHGLEEIIPGTSARSDAELEGFIRANARTVYHPVGTCAMGTGIEAVVDPQLKVRCVERLRVADASIMPTITSGNTNAPVIMIAEKAADMIAEDARTSLVRC